MTYTEADAQNLHMPYIHGVGDLWVHGFITILMASNIALFSFSLKQQKLFSPREKYKCKLELCIPTDLYH